jgi:epoxyqueuosine reductase QueG
VKIRSVLAILRVNLSHGFAQQVCTCLKQFDKCQVPCPFSSKLKVSTKMKMIEVQNFVETRFGSRL